MMICKGQKVDKKDINNLRNVFEYFDIKFGDDYPSLINDGLIDYPKLLENYFKDNIELEDSEVNMRLFSISDNQLKVNSRVIDKNGFEVNNTFSYIDNIEKESMCFKNLYNAFDKEKERILKDKSKEINNSIRM